MNVLFEQDGLEHLDQLGCEALILPFFDDERPPRGTLGLVDWRFAGLVSRLIQRGVVRGEAGATSLLPARRPQAAAPGGGRRRRGGQSPPIGVRPPPRCGALIYRSFA